MRSKLSEQIKRIPKSGIRDFFELVQSQENVISLGVGEPDYPAPWNVREAAIYSLEKGVTSYTSNLGLPSLRKEIVRYVESFFDVSYSDESEVIVTVGVSEAIDLALRALINPGDEVIYHEPCYVSYSPSIVLAYGVPVPIATKEEDEFSLTAKDLEAAITPKTKVVFLNFPTNPTGASLDLEEQRKIAELCVKHDLIVLTDEIYSELSYNKEPHRSIVTQPGMKERTVLLHGFSKAFAMTGFRLGYACGPSEIIDAMMNIHQYSMLCAPITSQIAAEEALKNSLDEVQRMKEDYQLRRDFVVSELNEMGLKCHLPGGAFYAFPSISNTGLKSSDFALNLLQKKGVAAVPGTAFGESGEGFLRCCYATSVPKLKQAVMSNKRLSKIRQWQSDVMLAHTMPLFLFVIVGFALSSLVDVLPFVENFSDSPWYYRDPDQWIKPVQLVVGLGVLYFFRDSYLKKDWNLSWKGAFFGVGAGLVGIAFWLTPTTLYDYLNLAEKIETSPAWFEWIGLEARKEGYNVDVFEGNVMAQSTAIFLRFVYACVVVSLVEEICWRSYVMRASLDWSDWTEQAFGRASWKTFLIPTALFISIHQPVDYLGALIYGSIAWGLTIKTKSLSSVVIMHAVANFTMGVYALAYGKFGLW